MKQLVWTLGSLFRLVSACDAKKSACTEVHSGSRLKTFSQTEHEYLEISTLWLFNIAMENGPFIDDCPIKTSIYEGFSMAMLNNQMVELIFLASSGNFLRLKTALPVGFYGPGRSAVSSNFPQPTSSHLHLTKGHQQFLLQGSPGSYRVLARQAAQLMAFMGETWGNNGN